MASLFTSQTPTGTNNSDGTPGITTATTVRFAQAGTVTAIRFYATTTVSGTYTGALWQVTGNDDPGPGTGTLLASKVGTTPTGGAWNLITLDTPVAVTTGVLYRVGVHSSAGRYVNLAGLFASALTNGDITAPATGDDPVGLGTLRQASFAINASLTYPATSGGGAAYFVDVEFTAGAAGTAFTRTVDDSTGLVDVQTRAVSRTLTDTVGLVDTQVRALARALTDTTGLTDPRSTASVFGRTTTDTLGLTDVAASVLTGVAYARAVTDDLGLTDTGSPLVLDVAETVSDLVGLTDSVSPVLTGGAGTAFTRTVDDAVGLSDSATTATALTRSLTEPTGLTDGASTLAVYARSVDDGVGLTDVATQQAAAAGARQVDDQLGLTDAVSYSSTQTLADSLGLVDTATLALAAARAASDALGLTDAVTVTLVRSVTVADSTGLTDSVSAQSSVGNAFARVITDQVGLTSSHWARQITCRPSSGTTSRPYVGVTSRYQLVPD